MAPLLPLLYPSDAVRQLWANTRFIGLYDQEIATPLGQRLFPRAPGGEARDLPLETPSYLLYLGDVHPPLAGFALLLFSLALVARLQRPEPPDDARPLTAALGASAVVPFALNAWILPLQGLLVAAWAAYRRASRQPLFMPWLLGGALTAAALLYPFLTYFSGRAAATPFVFTAAADFTPWRPGLAVWWPVLWLVLLSLLPGSPPRLARASALAVIGFWLLAEFVTVDDPNGGRYQRFNTVLKWWSWLYLGALVWLGALQLGAAARWRRVAAAVPLLAVSLYLWPQFLYWSQTPRPHAGRLQGDGWLRADAADRAILDWLKAAPPGVVLERTE
ncbi:MAG: hypothetical protein N2688_13090, partial [Burkholderiaceae bacterium]|nr:hypothetical protein [Burkholderiaceae bacterium]